MPNASRDFAKAVKWLLLSCICHIAVEAGTGSRLGSAVEAGTGSRLGSAVQAGTGSRLGSHLMKLMLHINVQQFRGGLEFKAQRLCLSPNSSLASNMEEGEEVDAMVIRFRAKREQLENVSRTST